MRTSGADPDQSSFLQVEFRELGGEQRRLVLDKEGVQVKLDVPIRGVLAIVSEGLDALVETVLTAEKCPVCEAESHDKHSDCELVQMLVAALGEIVNR